MTAAPNSGVSARKIIIRLLITAAILVIVMGGFQRRLGEQQDLLTLIQHHLAQIRWDWFILANAIYHAACLLGALRITLIARSQDVPIGFGTMLKNLYIGLLFNPLLMGATGGDVVRSWYLAKETGKKTEIITVVFLDRFVGICVLVSIALVALLSNLNNPNLQPILFRVCLLFLALVSFAGVISSRRIKNRMRFVKKFIPSRFIDIIRRTFETLNRAKKQTKVLLFASICTIFYQSLMIVVVWMVTQALPTIPDIPLRTFFLFMPIIFTLSAIPISPGGVGVAEALYAYFFAFVNVAEADAVTLALVYRGILVLASVVGGIVYGFKSDHQLDLPEEESPAAQPV